MKQMLHAVDHDRPVRVVGQRDDALHTQEFRPVRVAQQVQENLESARIERRVARQAEGADRGVMPVRIMRVPMAVGMIVAMAMTMPAIVEGLGPQPGRDIGYLSSAENRPADNRASPPSPRPSPPRGAARRD